MRFRFRNAEFVIRNYKNKSLLLSVKLTATGFLFLNFGIICSFKQIINRHIKIIGKCYKRFIICLMFPVFISAYAVLVHSQIHCKLKLRYFSFLTQFTKSFHKQVPLNKPKSTVNLFFIFQYIGYIAIKCGAYTVKNKSVIPFYLVFIIIVYHLILYVSAFCKLITADIKLFQSFIKS